MLIRMSRSGKISADGFTVVTVEKGGVYQRPADLGQVLVDEELAIRVDANSLREALPRRHVLAGRPAPEGG